MPNIFELKRYDLFRNAGFNCFVHLAHFNVDRLMVPLFRRFSVISAPMGIHACAGMTTRDNPACVTFIDLSFNQPINQSTNQPINQSTNQPINQSTNRHIL